MIIRLAYQLNGEMKDRQPSVFHIRRLQRRQQQPQHLRKVNAANLKETIVLIRNFILQKSIYHSGTLHSAKGRVHLITETGLRHKFFDFLEKRWP
jgi:deoxyxylulose-5-phosphate synthase